MIPIGPAYSALRALALGAMPSGTKALMGDSYGLPAFLGRGFFTVTHSDQSRILFEADDAEVSSAILGELELYLDQSLEQLVEVLRWPTSGPLRSDGWNVVTTYYFGFFVAQSVCRLLGTSSHFLDSGLVQTMHAAASAAGPRSPGGGAFVLARGAQVAAGRSEYALSKSSLKIHETTWKAVTDEIGKAVSGVTPTPDEQLFYSCLFPARLQSFYTKYDWAPMIRAKANYRPGFAYGLVSNSSSAKTEKLLHSWRNNTTAAALPALRSSANRLAKSGPSDYSYHVQSLADTSICLLFLARHLYTDVLERRRIDRRWEQRRVRLLKKVHSAGQLARGFGDLDVA